MNYKRLYNSIIDTAKTRATCSDTYYEKHHIIPKCNGGSDGANNLTMLTSREHFICHYLLTKIYKFESPEWYKLTHAFIMMCPASGNQSRYFNSRLYEYNRSSFSKTMSLAQSGENNSQYGTMWIHNPILKINKRIKSDSEILNGYIKGRVINWNTKDKKHSKTCSSCGDIFVPECFEKFCSKKCKKVSMNSKTTTAKFKPILDKLCEQYDITSDEITTNKDFIKKALDMKIPKNQILWRLGCNNSGANYKTINNIMH